MSLLLESVKIVDGVWQNTARHQDRMERSAQELFGRPFSVDFGHLKIPPLYRQGVVKCRVLYDTELREVGFDVYNPRMINSLKLVYDDQIDYHLKWADRAALNELLKRRGVADEILIVKDGRITDISYANVVLRYGATLVTPSDCLLAGTRRRQLLDDGLIVEKPITVDELMCCDSVIIINAMLGLDDEVEIPVSNIFR